MRARFDKLGRRLPDTGRGCGCQLCADTEAPRYERRVVPVRGSIWNPAQRWVVLTLDRILGHALL